MKSLKQILGKRISDFGPIKISEFMIEANQNQKLGYYHSTLPFGKKGDFVTSPELSQMFGELIGLWIIDCWKKMGEPKKFNIVELGPGTGTLLIDALRAININKKCKKSCKKIFLLETSIKLRKIQKKKITNENKETIKKICWIDTIYQIKHEPFILIANEFFDSLPIQQIQFTKKGWRERLIDFNKKKNLFYFTLSNHPTLLESFLPNDLKKNKKNGQIYEIPFHMITILTELFKKMKKVKGVMLIIDYTKKKIFGNTIKGVKNQKVINPLLNPGMVDLSAHVDFSIIRNISEKFCLKYYGPSIQRDFLIKLGIIERSIILKLNANNKQKNKIDNSLNFLINKKKMGEVFQVISMSSKNIKKIVGFL